MRIEDHLASLMRRMVDMEQRLDKTVRHGAVTDVDEKKHLIRMRIGGTDQEPLKSPWIPYGQIAGALKLHSMPSVGQTMTMYCPTGDFRQAMAMPLTWSDDNKAPSDKKDEHVLTFENVTITLKKDSLKFAVGDASVEINKDFVRALIGQSDLEMKSDKTNLKSTETFLPVTAKLHLGVDNKDEKATPLVTTDAGPALKVYAKA